MKLTWGWSSLLVALFLSACSAGLGTGATGDPVTGLTSVSGQKSGLGSQSAAFLAAINTARGQARNCKKPGGGTEPRSAQPALRWNDRLEAAAAAHTQDMVKNNFFAHQGSDNSMPWNRTTRAGYASSTVGENIAAGQSSIAEAVQAWLDSEQGHCQAIMDADYTEIGAAMLEGGASNTYSRYWTLDFGRR